MTKSGLIALVLVVVTIIILWAVYPINREREILREPALSSAYPAGTSIAPLEQKVKSAGYREVLCSAMLSPVSNVNSKCFVKRICNDDSSMGHSLIVIYDQEKISSIKENYSLELHRGCVLN